MAVVTYQPRVLSWRGGELIEMRYPWQGDLPFACTLVVSGQRYPCYSATAESGTECVPSGQLLRCGSPKLADATIGAAVIEIADATGKVLQQLHITIVPPFYPTTTYLLRALCPDVWACGPRDLGQEVVIS